MIDAVIERIQALDHNHEFQALTEHVAVTSPIALELLAHEHLTSPNHEARRIAAIQLRVVSEAADKLRWLERTCASPHIEPSTRLALAGVLHSLCADSDLLPVIDSEAAVMLEPTILFHGLLARLRPWIPPMVLSLEPESVLTMLQLGIPDYLHSLMRQRFESIWELFHRLRQLPPARLAAADRSPMNDEQLQGLIGDPRLAEISCPPAPLWTTQSWVTPWLSENTLRHPPTALANQPAARLD